VLWCRVGLWIPSHSRLCINGPSEPGRLTCGCVCQWVKSLIWPCIFRNGWTYFRETWCCWILREVIEPLCLWLNWMNVQTLGIKICIYLYLHFHIGLSIISCERQKKVLLTFILYWKEVCLLILMECSIIIWIRNITLYCCYTDCNISLYPSNSSTVKL